MKNQTYLISIVTTSASYLILCSRSISMRIYALKVDEKEPELCKVDLVRTLKPHNTPVVVCEVDETGSLLATGGTDGSVKVWDIRAGYVTHNFHGHGGLISAILFFQVAITSDTNHNKKRENKMTNGKIKGLENFSINGNTSVYSLASASEDGIIKIWSLHQRKCLSTLDSHYSIVKSLAYSRKDAILLSGSRDKTIMVWDAQTWKLRTTISPFEEVESCGLLLDGSIIFSGGESGRIRLWRTYDGNELTQAPETPREHFGITDIIYNQSLSYLFVIQSDQTFSIYSIDSLNPATPPGSIVSLPLKRRLFGTHDEIIDLACVGTDKSALALATNVEYIRLISIKDDPKNELQNKDMSWIETSGFGTEIGLLEGHEDIIISLDVDWSGNWIVTGAKDNTARLWRIDIGSRSHECYTVLSGHAEAVGAVSLPKERPPTESKALNDPAAFPPPFIITGSQDQTVKRWDVGEQVKTSRHGFRTKYTRKAHEKDINAIDIFHNNTLFASASQDRTAKIWDAEHGEAIGVLRGHKRGVWSVKFSPKDTPIIAGSTGGSGANRGFLLTGSGDRSVKVWSLSDYSCLMTLEGHTNSVLKVVWLNSSTSDTRDKHNVLASSAAGDGLVKVWNLSLGQAACTLDNHVDRVWALANKPDGGDRNKSQLISGGGDGIINFWVDKTSEAIEAEAVAEARRLQQEQQLRNLTLSGKLREAIMLALQLNHPARLFVLISNLIEGDMSALDNMELTNSQSPLDSILNGLADDQILSLLIRIRDWNASARTAPVAQKVLWTLVRCYPASRFSDLRARTGRKDGTLKDVLDAIRAYTEKHYQRLEGTIDESYLLEYTLLEMDGLTSNAMNGHYEEDDKMIIDHDA